MAPSGRRQMPNVASPETFGAFLPNAFSSRPEKLIPAEQGR